MTSLEISPLKLKMFNWHKWLGITILGLVAVRSLWRLTHRPPALLPMPAWQAAAAHGLHALLYVLMFVLPLSGWIYSNYAGFPIVYLSRIPLPTLVEKNRELAQRWQGYHQLLGWVLLTVIAMHVLAALKHHLVDRDDTMRRMLRWRSR
jgi:cytochrome b561